VILRSVCNGIVLPKEWKGTLKECPNVRETVKSIVIFFNDYPNNHHTIQFKYILFSTAV
jgi:hypothetical protein